MFKIFTEHFVKEIDERVVPIFKRSRFLFILKNYNRPDV
jgi:hypothetical protein